MTDIVYTGDALWERIERAVENVKDRLRRVTQALETAEIPYAVVGGNAVQFWVAQADESAVRNTRDVDIVLNREDFPAAQAALEAAGFLYRRAASVSMFLDGPQAKARDAVHVVFAGEKVREDYPEPVPSIDHCERIRNVRLMPLESLVRMKLTSNRDKDRVHVRDMIAVGLVDESWLERFALPLSETLRELLNDPDG
jgi:hypothetical protein